MKGLKRSLLFLLTIFCTHSLSSQELQQVRNHFEKATVEEEANEELLELLEPVRLSQPLLYGYKGAALMVSAKYSINPFRKLSRFNKGKKMLEAALDAAGDQVELRFLRLAIQKNTPAFLGYNEAIGEDTQFLEKALPGITDGYLKKQVTSQLKENGNAD